MHCPECGGDLIDDGMESQFCEDCDIEYSTYDLEERQRRMIDENDADIDPDDPEFLDDDDDDY